MHAGEQEQCHGDQDPSTFRLECKPNVVVELAPRVSDHHEHVEEHSGDEHCDEELNAVDEEDVELG